MLAIINHSQKTRILSAIGCGAFLSIILALYLVFTPDIKARANWNASISGLYLNQSSKNGYRGDYAGSFLEKAYQTQMSAVQLYPYDAEHWLQLSTILAAKNAPDEHIIMALDIAATLAPHRITEIEAYKSSQMRKAKRIEKAQP